MEMVKDVALILTVSMLGAGLSITLSAMFAALGQAKAIAAALEAIGRNPEAQPKIQIVMIIGLAFIESLALYALFISLLLIFANPFTAPLIQLLGTGGGH